MYNELVVNIKLFFLAQCGLERKEILHNVKMCNMKIKIYRMYIVACHAMRDVV